MGKRLTKEMREFVSILIRNGYSKARSKGSHWIYENDEIHRHISINTKLNKMIRARLIKENNLEV